MAENSSGGEKTEQPTPKKLEDARKEGQVALSTEVNIATLMILGFCTMAVVGPWMWRAMETMMRSALGPGMLMDLNERETILFFTELVLTNAGWFVPLLAVLFIGGISISVAQIGFRVSWKPIVPKFTRISPITGFGRLFGLRGLMRFVFSFMKLTLLMIISWHILSVDIPKMVVMKIDISERVASESWTIFIMIIKLASVLFIIAIGDFLYQRFQHNKDQMMTKQEIKEEVKQSEGDPLIKAKIRQIQRQMAQRRMMQEVPKADVIITNPTHVAVALKYDKDKMSAPVVVAKGYDEVAQRIKEIAKKHGIVQVENVTLARALAKEVEVGRAVPVKWYQAVAEILSMVYKLKKPAA